MISVLIPVYNYHVVALVNHIHTQLQLCGTPFEIICLDDASTDDVIVENEAITKLVGVSYHRNDHNLGRIASRQRLAEYAHFDYLLFLDADVMPKTTSFVAYYLKYLHTDYDAVYGGVAYTEDPPDSHYLLRWTYGKRNEEIAASTRNKTPFKNIVSANFLIKKSVFLKVNGSINYHGYGGDNYVSAAMKREHTTVLHIDNYVYHLGLETSAHYLKKIEAAAEALLSLYHSEEKTLPDNQLLQLFTRLKRYKLNHLVAFVYRIFGNMLRHNLLGKHPSITGLQLYRICYLCKKNLERQ